MDDVGRYIINICLLLLITIITGVFSANQIAIFSLNESSLKKLVDNGNKSAQHILKLKEKSFIFYTKCFASVIICLTFACWLAVFTFSQPFAQSLTWLNLNSTTNIVLSNIVLLLICVTVILVLGIILPKRIAFVTPEKIALSTNTLLRFLLAVFSPLTIIPFLIAKALTKIFRIDSIKHTNDVTEEEIRLMVDAGNENGSIELSEKEMINNVFEFDDRTVDEVMTHRTDVIAVEKSDKISDVIYFAINEGFSRIPVYDDDIDNIIGIMYAKDLLCLVGCNTSEEFSIKDFIRPIIYVPESTRCRMLFKEFKEKKMHMAVVVDEYGGTAGIVTMEDLLESIVGNIQDEYDQEDDEIKRVDEQTYSLDGSLNIDELEKLFNIEIESDDGETLGGVISNTLGRIPEDGENPTIILQDIEFTVTLVEDRRISRVNAKVLSNPQTHE